MTLRIKCSHVPGGKASIIVDNASGEIEGLSGMGVWWEEDNTTRFVKRLPDGIKLAASLSETGMRVFELVYQPTRANPRADEIKLSQYVAHDWGQFGTGRGR